MSIEAHYILGAIAIGIGANLAIDLWNLFLKRTFSIPSLHYCLLGRWFRHMSGGSFRHASITAAPQQPFECTVGWIAHYTIGVVFALVFVVLTSGDWLERPTLLPALLYGIGTVVFPFFIMQPSFGLGLLPQTTPKPMQARLKSLVTHTVFGVGLYVCALGVSYVLRLYRGWFTTGPSQGDERSDFSAHCGTIAPNTGRDHSACKSRPAVTGSGSCGTSNSFVRSWSLPADR